MLTLSDKKLAWLKNQLGVSEGSLADLERKYYAKSSGLPNTRSLNDHKKMFYAKEYNLLSLEDSSFEGGTLGSWNASNNCAVSRSTAQAYEGTASLAMTANALGFMTASRPGLDNLLIPGKYYTFSARFRAATTGRAISIYVTYFDTSGTYIGASSSATGNDFTSTWAMLVLSFVPPANTFRVNLQVQINDSTTAAGEVHYVDDIKLQPGTISPNLLSVTDSSFEDGTVGGWASGQGANDPVNSTDIAFSGTNSLKTTIVSPTDSNFCSHLDVYFPAVGSYMVSGRVYMPSGWTMGDASITLEGGTAVLTQVKTAQALGTLLNQWQRVVTTINVTTPGATALVFRYSGPISSSNEVIYIDAIKVEYGSVPTTDEENYGGSLSLEDLEYGYLTRQGFLQASLEDKLYAFYGG